MENASKALLIAASLLIVILLIAMGMKVFNSTAGTTDNVETTMNATEIATFNSKFTAYAGTKSLSQVKALANVVIANNATSDNKVKFNEDETANGITSIIANLAEGTYEVGFQYAGGLVSSITVKIDS